MKPMFMICLTFAMTIATAQMLRAAPANCAPHDAVVARLADAYGESRQIIGLTANGAVIEIFAAEGGSWTLTVTAPGGPTCLVAAGDHYQTVSEPLPNTDPDA
ncbi:MAG: hypothetical protein LC676_09910 [Loktanella sp.]|nr:hypothetical protein [Loktanella sp.]